MTALTHWNPFKEVSEWNPLRELDEMNHRLSRIFGGTTARTGKGREEITVANWAPLVDITEDDKEYIIKAELPEVKKNDVKVRVEDGVLYISGERNLEKEEKGKRYHRIAARGCRCGTGQRGFQGRPVECACGQGQKCPAQIH